jgi:ribosome-associated translation inhibitor RaiA
MDLIVAGRAQWSHKKFGGNVVRVEITSSLQTSRDVEAYVETRLRSALASFIGQLESVKVSVSHADNREETTLKCRIKVRIHPSGIWLIHDTCDADPYAAVDRGVDGIRNSFMRWLARSSGRGIFIAA